MLGVRRSSLLPVVLVALSLSACDVLACEAAGRTTEVDSLPWLEGHTCTEIQEGEDSRTESRVERDARGRVTRFETRHSEALDTTSFAGFRRVYEPDGRVVDHRVEARAEVARWRQEHSLAPDGRVLESREEHGGSVQTVRYGYDDRGRLVESAHAPAGTTSRFVHSDDGRTIDHFLELRGRDPERLRRWIMDSAGRLESVETTRERSPTRTVRYVRDDRGRVIEERELEGHDLVSITRCRHDSHDRRVACTWDYGADETPELRTTYRYDSGYGPYPCDPELLIPAPIEL